MAQPNFLIGRGELLTADIPPIKRKMDEKYPLYTFVEAKAELLPQFVSASQKLDNLPDAACPGDVGVVRMTLNPAFISKTSFPGAFLASANLMPIGSRNTQIVPKKTNKKKKNDDPATTTELFVAGKRSTLRRMGQIIENFDIDSAEALQLTRFERIAKFEANTSVDRSTSKEDYFEVAIHLLPNGDPTVIQYSFKKYASRLGFMVFDRLSFQAGTLWFVPVCGATSAISTLSQFVFVRMIRNVPKLRGFHPVKRASGVPLTCQLPTVAPLSSVPRVAILDGGLPEKHALSQWINAYTKLDEDAEDVDGGTEHGLGVTSAFLFGPIRPQYTASRPFSYVDHLRVLDSKSDEEDPLELYRTLGLIEQVLLSRQYEFINLSLGPDLPIDDGEVHTWTAVLDDLLSDGETLMTVAAGNNGERDWDAGNARIQVPADCVNALSVGSASNMMKNWQRAIYSAIGPGRRPGFVKPDVLAFGGDSSSYFHVIAPGKNAQVSPELGTSYASPYLLRNAVGIRAVLGEDLSTLAIKALLIHAASAEKFTKQEVGWGKVPDDIMEIITCKPGVARVVYQGTLIPGKFIRAKLPIPITGLVGRCKLKATFCYASPIDPQDSGAYTRAALEITFRRNEAKKSTQAQNAKSDPFFQAKIYATEEERRTGLSKWENVLHAQKSLVGTTLNNPVFDIHYIAREAAADTRRGKPLAYALILTIEAHNHPNLFNEILQSYPVLVQIQPQVSLPIRV
jgi:hypothetical protein